jgi:hypothetical protein
MGEQSDWYERGCNRSCRNSHTKVWGRCNLAEEPAPVLNLMIAKAFTASDGNTSVGIRQATVEEARAELAKFETQPDWRDVFRAFLSIGPRLLERVSTNGNCRWRYETEVRTKGGLRELVDVLHFPTESMWIVKLGIYGSTHMVSLKNPTPAEILTAAKLVGLVGGVS